MASPYVIMGGNSNNLKQDPFYNMKKNSLILGLLFIFFFILAWPSKLHLSFPDTFYHFAISKLMAEHGLIHSLTSVSDLSWSQHFSDKEFLYHFFTAIFYKMFGDYGVIIINTIFSVLTLLLLFVLSNKYLDKVSTSLLFIIVLLDHSWLSRLMMVRPHTAAIFCFCILLYGLITKRKKLVALSLFLFPLFYHAYYVAIFTYVFIASFDKTTTKKDHLTYAIFPFFLGIIINPYFPTNIYLTFIHLKIALLGSQVTDIGSELIPASKSATLNFFGLFFIFTLYFCYKFKEQKTLFRLGVLSLFFGLILFFSPRIQEYYYPIAIIFFSLALSNYEQTKRIKYLTIALLIITAVHSQNYFEMFKSNKNDSAILKTQAIQDVLSIIPADDHSKIFNCQWELGSYILYFRPNNPFVDLLEPNLLADHSWEKYKVRNDLVSGATGQISSKTISELFHSEYAFCLIKDNSNLFKNDSNIVEIKSVQLNKYRVALFKVKH